MRAVVIPLEKASERRRTAGERAFTRGHQLQMKFRVFRTLCFLRNESVTSIANMCGQCPRTVSWDVKNIIDLIDEELSPVWVRMPEHTTEEYDCLRGGGDFSGIGNIVYSADCTIVIIPKPTINQADYYHGGKKKHCFLMLTFVNGFGQTVFVAGPIDGNEAEIRILEVSSFFRDIPTYVISTTHEISSVM